MSWWSSWLNLFMRSLSSWDHCEKTWIAKKMQNERKILDFFIIVNSFLVIQLINRICKFLPQIDIIGTIIMPWIGIFIIPCTSDNGCIAIGFNIFFLRILHQFSIIPNFAICIIPWIRDFPYYNRLIIYNRTSMKDPDVFEFFVQRIGKIRIKSISIHIWLTSQIIKSDCINFLWLTKWNKWKKKKNRDFQYVFLHNLILNLLYGCVLLI